MPFDVDCRDADYRRATDREALETLPKSAVHSTPVTCDAIKRAAMSALSERARNAPLKRTIAVAFEWRDRPRRKRSQRRYSTGAFEPIRGTIRSDNSTLTGAVSSSQNTCARTVAICCFELPIQKGSLCAPSPARIFPIPRLTDQASADSETVVSPRSKATPLATALPIAPSLPGARARINAPGSFARTQRAVSTTRRCQEVLRQTKKRVLGLVPARF